MIYERKRWRRVGREVWGLQEEMRGMRGGAGGLSTEAGESLRHQQENRKEIMRWAGSKAGKGEIGSSI